VRLLHYEISHTTRYDYAGSVSLSHHLLRLTPRRTSRQNPVTHEIEIHPAPTTITAHGDYFGNTARFLAVEQPHHRLTITARSRIEVRPAYIPDPAETPSWEAVRARTRADRSGVALDAHEFTYSSALVPLRADFADYAAASFLSQRPLLEAANDLTARIHRDFKFDPTATTVTTPVADVFRLRRGVCQDFAHFQIACLRSLGLPARYVSGYLETDPPPGQAKLRGSDASHAWVSCYCPGQGWLDLDPTNNCPASLRHVTIAWGRDYADVAPVRGVLIGGRGQALSVSVDVVGRESDGLTEGGSLTS